MAPGANAPPAPSSATGVGEGCWLQLNDGLGKYFDWMSERILAGRKALGGISICPYFCDVLEVWVCLQQQPHLPFALLSRHRSTLKGSVCFLIFVMELSPQKPVLYHSEQTSIWVSSDYHLLRFSLKGQVFMEEAPEQWQKRALRHRAFKCRPCQERAEEK